MASERVSGDNAQRLIRPSGRPIVDKRGRKLSQPFANERTCSAHERTGRCLSRGNARIGRNNTQLHSDANK